MPVRLIARTPLPADDGWSVATLRDVGLKAAPVEEWLNQLLATQPGLRAPYVQSVQIARHGKLVLDEYFYGFAADQPHDMRSAGKTLDDILVGSAQYRGARIGEDTRIAPFYRNYAPFAHDDARKARITVGKLLTMTPGLACDDNDDESPGQEDRVQQTPDWYRTTLDLPVVSDPGTKAVYCSQGQNLIGGVLTATTHTWLPAFFHDAVARELQWRDYYVPMMPTGSMYLGGGEQVRPRDFLKIGQLMLDGGVWHGKRLMSRAWVARSLASHASLTAPSDYGYAWHVYTFTVAGKTYRAEQAGGNGGQMLFIVRDLDLAVMITAGNYGDFATWSRFADFIPRYVIPAAL
jgi:CubicO group peptidase (beta-lactamase class C family)